MFTYYTAELVALCQIGLGDRKSRHQLVTIWYRLDLIQSPTNRQQEPFLIELTETHDVKFNSHMYVWSTTFDNDDDDDDDEALKTN